MKELLEFILADFWRFIGTLVLIHSTGVAINHALIGLRGKCVKIS